MQKNAGIKSFTATAALVRGVRVKLVAGEAVVTGDGEEGIGVTIGGAAIGGPVAVELDGHTVEVIAAEVMAVNDNCFPAAAGEVKVTPSGLRVGIALEAAGINDKFEMLVKPLGA